MTKRPFNGLKLVINQTNQIKHLNAISHNEHNRPCQKQMQTHTQSKYELTIL